MVTFGTFEVDLCLVRAIKSRDAKRFGYDLVCHPVIDLLSFWNRRMLGNLNRQLPYFTYWETNSKGEKEERARVAKRRWWASQARGSFNFCSSDQGKRKKKIKWMFTVLCFGTIFMNVNEASVSSVGWCKKNLLFSIDIHSLPITTAPQWEGKEGDQKRDPGLVMFYWLCLWFLLVLHLAENKYAFLGFCCSRQS